MLKEERKRILLPLFICYEEKKNNDREVQYKEEGIERASH